MQGLKTFRLDLLIVYSSNDLYFIEIIHIFRRIILENTLNIFSIYLGLEALLQTLTIYFDYYLDIQTSLELDYMFISLSDFDFVFHVSYDFYLSFVVDNRNHVSLYKCLSDTIMQ